MKRWQTGNIRDYLRFRYRRVPALRTLKAVFRTMVLDRLIDESVHPRAPSDLDYSQVRYNISYGSYQVSEALGF